MSETKARMLPFDIRGPEGGAPGEDRILAIRLFREGAWIVGSFAAFVYEGALRIHIVLDEDTDAHDGEIAARVADAMEQAGVGGTIWIEAGNRALIDTLTAGFSLLPRDEDFLYHSFEYQMARVDFVPLACPKGLAFRPYEEAHLDEYLAMLSESMSFKAPHHDYGRNRALYAGEFARLRADEHFEALWQGGTLLGLYWSEGLEIDHMAVAPMHQRRGYGGLILSRAIEAVLAGHPESDHVLLYAVGWNAQAQGFYQRFGMRRAAVYRVPM